MVESDEILQLIIIEDTLQSAIFGSVFYQVLNYYFSILFRVLNIITQITVDIIYRERPPLSSLEIFNYIYTYTCQYSCVSLIISTIDMNTVDI